MCWCHAPRGSRHGRRSLLQKPLPQLILIYRYQQLKHDPWLSVLSLFDLCSHFWVHRSGGISVLCNKGRIQQKKHVFSRWYPPTDNLSNTNSNKYSDILSDILLYLAFSLTFLLTFYLAFYLAFYLTFSLTCLLTCLLTFYMAFYLTYILVFYLAFYPTIYLA